jgi:hypothetical protein
MTRMSLWRGWSGVMRLIAGAGADRVSEALLEERHKSRGKQGELQIVGGLGCPLGRFPSLPAAPLELE